MMHDIIVFENLCFSPSTRKRKAGDLKISSLECIFERCVFNVRFQRIRWAVGQMGGKNIRFQCETYTCGQGLNVMLHGTIQNDNF